MISGVAEEGATFAGLGRFRTIAGVGPVYEILERSGDVLRIEVVHTGEVIDYPGADAVRDPLA